MASRTQTLTADNYDSLVVQGDQVWVINVWREFNCERCIQVSEAWEEAAKQMSGIVNFGRINFDRQGNLCEKPKHLMGAHAAMRPIWYPCLKLSRL